MPHLLSFKNHRISIHAPRVGSDNSQAHKSASLHPFQSTLPVWGATSKHHHAVVVTRISIHAPRVGSDSTCKNARFMTGAFQSTLPVWGATELPCKVYSGAEHFNPRSPCGERLHYPGVCTVEWLYFNPRSPCGERRLCMIHTSIE